MVLNHLWTMFTSCCSPLLPEPSSLCWGAACANFRGRAAQISFGSALPLMSMSCGHQLASLNVHLCTFPKRGKKNGQCQQRSGWASLKMWDLSRDSKGVGQLAKRFCGGRALLGGSARALHQERAWCAHRAGEQEDSGRRGWARPEPVPDYVTAQNLWQILTFILSELEFF